MTKYKILRIKNLLSMLPFKKQKNGFHFHAKIYIQPKTKIKFRIKRKFIRLRITILKEIKKTLKPRMLMLFLRLHQNKPKTSSSKSLCHFKLI